MAIDASNLLASNTLVINQRAKLFELRNQFSVLDETGQQVGRVEEINRSPLAVFTRVVSDFDVALPMTLALQDNSGQHVLVLHKPWFRWGATVSSPAAGEIGRITKEIRLGKARFALTGMNGERLGTVHALNWRAKDFSIRDANDVEVARINKRWAGMAKEIFTDADNYVIEVMPGLGDPLRSMAFATSLAIDTVMKNKDSGGGISVGDVFGG